MRKLQIVRCQHSDAKIEYNFQYSSFMYLLINFLLIQ